MSGARRVREFATIGPMVGEVSADRVLRSRHCAPELTWSELCALVVPWALARGCEVERLTEETSDSGACVLRVFPPDADERGSTLEWVEPREACAECGELARLVQLPSGHVEVEGCACDDPRDGEPCDDCARSSGPHYRGGVC